MHAIDPKTILLMLKPKPKLMSIPFQLDWVLYEDDDIIVVNKPAGLLSVPGKDLDPEMNLLAQVQKHVPTALIVHRLDMDTSGIMILAKHKASHRHLSIQFQDRLTEKTYQAICFGKPSTSQGHLNLPMRCDWENRPLQIIDLKQGKAASTHWKLTAQYDNAFEVNLTPVTGRSHQLRLHMKMLGHPILGDNLYADPQSFAASKRLLLHAASLKVTHPVTKKTMLFEHPTSLKKFLTGTFSA
uniref:Pseudouridine synthase n=1 Tax=Hydrogenovibrio crunogenus (strain DSM 25203 / XCL-2) TaxID=317025 RepID=Q31HX2_HYDCU